MPRHGRTLSHYHARTDTEDADGRANFVREDVVGESETGLAVVDGRANTVREDVWGG